MVELRLDVDERLVSLLDACCQAQPGMSRSALVRRVLDEWAEHEIHRAHLICRVCGIATETERKRGGG